MLTLDAWSESPDPSVLILGLAEMRGPSGFTAEDIRDALASIGKTNPGAYLGALCATGRIRAVRDEPSRIPSSKGRRVRRFVHASWCA